MRKGSVKKLPPITFPQVNIGIDCEEVERWRELLPELIHGSYRRLFTRYEHNYCRSFADPAPHYAVRWCAKEAFLKAVSTFCKVTLRDIEVRNDKNGNPSIRIVSQKNRKSIDIIVQLSLSHTDSVALAMVFVIVNTKGKNLNTSSCQI